MNQAEVRAAGSRGTGGATSASHDQEAIERLRACLRAVRITYDIGRADLRATERAIRHLQRRSMAPSANEFWETTAWPRAQKLVDETQRVIDRELAALADPAVRALLEQALPTTAGIDELGRWWQRRLRRAALVRALPSIAAQPPRSAGLVTSDHEMRLLDSPPWSHGDRLLSAFEVAHREIATYGQRRLSVLDDPVRAVPFGRTPLLATAS